MKMVQNEEFANHHNKELDKHIFTLEVTNETKGQSFSKRLFFNKLQLPLGFVDIRLGDQLKLSYTVRKAGYTDDESEKKNIETIATF